MKRVVRGMYQPAEVEAPPQEPPPENQPFPHWLRIFANILKKKQNVAPGPVDTASADAARRAQEELAGTRRAYRRGGSRALLSDTRLSPPQATLGSSIQ